jgi:membrane protein insertase Oxa1/YidC/SpoIIIJ
MARILYIACRLFIGLTVLAVGINYVMHHNVAVGLIHIVSAIGALVGQQWAYTFLFCVVIGNILYLPNSGLLRQLSAQKFLYGSLAITALLTSCMLANLLANYMRGKDYGAVWNRNSKLFNTLLWVALASTCLFILLTVGIRCVRSPVAAATFDFGPILFFLTALFFAPISLVATVIALPYLIVSRLPSTSPRSGLETDQVLDTSSQPKP